MNHGSTERTGKAGNLISHIWSAGYDTHWFGDVSQLPADPLVLGFETWVGFRDSHEASIPEPTHFWTNGRKIVLEHQAETDQLERLSPAEMLLNATVRTLKSHQRSRPVLAVSFIAPREATAAQFDTIPLRMIELLDQTGLFASTVLVVAGVPTGSDSQRAPCFIIWPRHDSGGAVVETPANWSDVAATIGEVTEVPTSRLGFGGESQLKLWRPD